jgi:hypothetical protein
MRLFENKLTTSSIIICDCGKRRNNNIEYHDILKSKVIILKKCLLDEKWIFYNIKKRTKNLFGDHFIAASSIATQCNRAFVINSYTEDKEYVYFNDYKIEKNILREAASPRSKNLNKKEYIIFPYKNDHNKIEKYADDELTALYPFAIKYLYQYYQSLLGRHSDKNAKWFEYGRSQALTHLDQRKLLLSTLITGNIRIYPLKREIIPYSGIYITCNSSVYNLEDAFNILKGKHFLDYAKKIGICANSGSFRISAYDINNYYF